MALSHFQATAFEPMVKVRTEEKREALLAETGVVETRTRTGH